MYQLEEVKRWLVEYRYPSTRGWKVFVDVDAMERANGGQHSPNKAPRAQVAEDALKLLGVNIEPHPKYGRADIVAEHPESGVFVIEVEGDAA